MMGKTDVNLVKKNNYPSILKDKKEGLNPELVSQAITITEDTKGHDISVNVTVPESLFTYLEALKTKHLTTIKTQVGEQNYSWNIIIKKDKEYKIELEETVKTILQLVNNNHKLLKGQSISNKNKSYGTVEEKQSSYITWDNF